MIYIGLYILAMIAFVYWDAAVGFGCEWDNKNLPPLELAAFFWWIAVPGVIFFRIVNHLQAIKNKRLAKEVEQERIRVATQQDFNSALEEVDEEFPVASKKHHV